MRLVVIISLIGTHLFAQPSYKFNTNQLHGYQKLRIFDIHVREDTQRDTFRLITNKYNEHGRIKSQLISESDGAISLEKFEYEQDTFLTWQYLYKGETGDLVRTSKTEYTDQLQKQRVTHFDSEGKEQSRTELCYDKSGRLKRQRLYFRGSLKHTKRIRYNKEGNVKCRRKGEELKIEKKQLEDNVYIETHFTESGKNKELYHEIWKRRDGSIIREKEYLHSEGDAIGFLGSQTIIRMEKDIHVERLYNDEGNIKKERIFMDGELLYESHYEYIP